MKLTHAMLAVGVLLSSGAFAASVQVQKSDSAQAVHSAHQPVEAHKKHHHKKK